MRYAVIEIPLNRPEVIDFLTPPRAERHGTQVHILAQRPAPTAERAWIDQLRTTHPPALTAERTPHTPRPGRSTSKRAPD